MPALLVLATGAEAAAFSASASSKPRSHYLGDTGTTFGFTVSNTGSSTSIGAVEIRRPSTAWTVRSCPVAPFGWRSQPSDTMCRYRSQSTTSDDIKPGKSSPLFALTADVVNGAEDITGTWIVTVSRTHTFENPSTLASAPAGGSGLDVTAHSFEVIAAGIADGAAAPGASCPTLKHEAITASTQNIVVCGRNRSTTTATPSAAHSTLGGTFVNTPGTFSSGAIAPGSSTVVLGTWTGAVVTSAYGQGKTVVAKIASSATKSSPETTVASDYHATNRPPDAVNDTAATDEGTPVNIPALANDSDPDGDMFSVTAHDSAGSTGGVITAGLGGLTFNPNGAFESLAPGESRTSSFNYTVTDVHGATDTATVTVTVTGLNDAPVAADDADSLDEDSAKTLPVLGNDTDADTSQTKTVSAVDTTGTTGTVVNNGSSITYNTNGQFEYLGANQSATDTFTYTVSDGAGGTDTAIVTITVNGVNDAPNATNDDYSTDEATQIGPLPVLVNDTDSEGAVSITGLSATTKGGSVTNNGDGTVTYNPNGAFEGLANGQSADDTFTYTVTDAQGATDTATVTVTVNGINDAPVAGDDPQNVNEDSSGDTVLVLADDTDAEGQTLTVTGVDTTGTTGQVTNHGTHLAYNPNGMFEYLGDGQTATDTFTYTVTDSQGGTDTATVTVTVVGDNDAPVSADDAYATDEATQIGPLPVLVNDTDSEGAVSITGISATSQGGSVTDNGDGTVTYNPNGAFEDLANGESEDDTFTYTVTDAQGATDTATVTVTVNGVNDAPVANDDAAGAGERVSGVNVDVLANDTDTESQTLTVSGVDTTGTVGQVTNHGTHLSYNPNGAFNHLGDGQTATDTFTYTATDSQGGTDTAKVTVTVTGSNAAPDAVDDADNAPESATKAINVLGNDTDSDGTPLTVTSVDKTGMTGDVTITNGGANVTYNPNGQFETMKAGQTATDTFTYTVSDGQGGTDTATATITVNGANDNPAATDDTGAALDSSSGETVNVLANDTDIEGDSLTVSAVDTTGTLGQVTNNGGNVTYKPNGAFNSLQQGATATDTFTYTASDGNGGTDVGLVTITVTGTNSPATAVDDADSTNEDTAKAVNVLGNDTDSDGDTLKVTAVDTTGTTGTVTITNGGADVTFNPNGQFDPLDVNGSQQTTFKYTVDDGSGNTSQATVTMTVTGLNDAPVADAEAASTNEDTAANVDVLNGDTDAEGHSLTVSAVNTTGTLGQVTNNGTNVSYNPNGAFNHLDVGGSAQDTFTYTVSDGHGGTDVETVTVTVTGLNDPPVGNDDPASTNEDTNKTVSVLANDTDPESHALSITAFDAVGTNGGTVTQSGNDLVWAHNGDFNDLPAGGQETTSFGYTVSDGNGGTDTATVTVTVTGVNDTPDAVNDAHNPSEDTTGTINVLANDTDPDTGDTKTVSAVDTTNTVGTVTNNGTNVGYDPRGKFDHLQVGQTATDTFTYTVTDGQGATDTATVTVTVSGVNDAPTATNKSHSAIGNTLLAVETTSVHPHTTSTGLLTAGVTDPDDTVFTASAPSATSTNSGNVTANSDGSFTFVPPQGYTGNDTFTFKVHDAHGGEDDATVTVTVANMAWYVNNAAGAAGDGRSSSPFNTLAPLTTAGSADAKDGANDHIFVYQGGSAYTGGLVMETGQKLWGQPHGLTVAGKALVPAGGSAPSIGGGVTLPSNGDVQGVTLGTHAANYALSGTNVGTTAVGTTTAVTVNNPTGGGVSVNGGTPTITLGSLTSGAGASGLNLTNVNGPVTVQGGAISGFTGTGVSVSGGTGAVTSSATVTAASAARSVSVVNHGTNDVTLSGNITDNGLGVNLDNNDGSNVHLTGQLSLNTGGNTAFNAVNGGTVSAPHTSNSASTTTGKAVNVVSSTIHSTGLKFGNVSSNGAVSGIVLDTTGNSGSLAVTNGSIQNSTSHGIDLNATLHPQFNSVDVANSVGQGVEGTNLTHFTYTNGNISNSGTGGAASASNIGLNATGTGTEQNVTGNVTITGNNLATARHHGVDIFNYSGTISDLNVSNNVITSATDAASSAGSGIRVHAFGGTGNVASVTKAAISGNNIDNFPNGAGIVVQGGNASAGGPSGTVGTPGHGTNKVLISGNEIDGDPTTKMGTNGILVTMNGKGTGHYEVVNNGTIANPMNNIKGVMISGGVFGNATATIKVDGNRLVGDTAGFDPPGIGIGTSQTSAVTDAPTANVTVTNNVVSGTEGQGIMLTARDASGTLNARVQNNTVSAPNTAGARQGIRVDSGNTVAGSDESVCLDISGNTSAGSISGAMGIGLRKQGTSTTVNTFGIVGNPATASPGVEAYVDSQNPAGGGTLLISATSGFSSCTLPF